MNQEITLGAVMEFDFVWIAVPEIKYFLVAILFVLFDVEVIFFYPYAVNFRSLGWEGFVAVILFVGFFLAGFFYIIKNILICYVCSLGTYIVIPTFYNTNFIKKFT